MDNWKMFKRHESRAPSSLSKNKSENKVNSKRKFTGKCLKCGKIGHKVRDCFKLKNPEEAKEFLEKHLNERGRPNLLLL
jgi:hypothetical protein